MAVIGTLAVNVMARTQGFERGIANVRRGVRGLTPSIGALTTSLGGVGGTVGLGGAVVSLGSRFEMLNRSMNRSLSIMGNVSGAMRQKMTQAAIDVSEVTNASATDAANAYFYLASAGLDANQALAAMPQVAMFAQAGNFDLARATDLATDAQSALGLTVKDAAKNLENMTRVTDVLTKANVLANASVEQFSVALTNGAGVALKIVNKDIEEGVAVLAAFADQGIKAEEAGTAFGIIMRDLQTKAIENTKAFKDAKVTVFDTNGEMRNLADIVADLEKGMAGLSDQAKKTFLMDLGFADKSVKNIQALIGTSDKIREYEKQLRAAGGTTKEVADKMLTPLEKSLNKLSAAWSRVGQNMEKPVGLLARITEGSANVMDVLTGKTNKATMEREAETERIRMQTRHNEFRNKVLRAQLEKTPGTPQYEEKQSKIRTDITKWMGAAIQRGAGGLAGGLGGGMSGGLKSLQGAAASGLAKANMWRLTQGPQLAGAVESSRRMAEQERAEKAKKDEEERRKRAEAMRPGPLAALQAGSVEAFQAIRKNLQPGGDVGKQQLNVQKETAKKTEQIRKGIEKLVELYKNPLETVISMTG